MATTTTITKLLFRRGNDADRIQTILASGEPGFALDTGRIWIGDGATPGGIPVIKSSDHHLHYVDDTGAVEGKFSRHSLDINMAGLSATMAGDRIEPGYAATPRLFHPTDRIVYSNYPIELTGENEEEDGLSISFTSDNGNNEFKIGRPTPGIINIGDVILIDTDSKTISLNAGGRFAVNASEQLFAEASDTLFEDKSIDLNTPITNEVRQRPGSTDASHAYGNGTGHYYAHMGVLSAGKVGIKEELNQAAFNTLCIRPTAYAKGWEGVGNLKRRLQGNITTDANPPLPRLALYSNPNDPTGTNESHNYNGAGVMFTEVNPNNSSAGHNATALTYGGEDQYMAKNIEIRSVRPGDQTSASSVYANAAGKTVTFGNKNVDLSNRDQSNPWAGPVNLVFETGLIVYGPGDRDVQPDYNGYLINQSLDSMAYPTFQGLRIEGPGAKPIGVESGGTGRDTFTPGRVIKAGEPGNTDPFDQIGALGQGNIIGCNNAGHHVWARMAHDPADWFNQPRQANGNVTITNKFIPNTTTAPGNHHKQPTDAKRMFFDKWSSIHVDTTTTEGTRPKRFDGQLKLTGDQQNLTTDITPSGTQGGPASENNGLYTWSTTTGPMDTVTFHHVDHAVDGGAHSKTTVNGDILTLDPGGSKITDDPNGANETSGNGSVLSQLTLNKGGHIRDFKCKDLDDRYSLVQHVGTKGRRSSGLFRPGDFTPTISNSTPGSSTVSRVSTWLQPANNATFNAQIIDGIEFNDYGTVHSMSVHNLGINIYSRSQVADILERISSTVDDIYVELGNRLSRNANSNTTGTIATSWLNGSKVQFGSGNTATSKLYEDSDEMHITSTKQLNFTGQGHDFIVQGARCMQFNKNYQYFYSNSEHIATVGPHGITMEGNNKLIGMSTYAENADRAMVMEDDTDTYAPVVFVNSGSSGGYQSLKMDDGGLYYDAKNNVLSTGAYKGDGRYLDMSLNTTIPPTVELKNASSGNYNVVLCQTDRHKIYDKTNTIQVNADAGHLYTKGDVVAFNAFSDKRLKKNITTLDSQESLDKVLKLSGVTFEWKHENDLGERVGLIAQQVEQVVPQVVTESPRADDMDKTYKRVDYEALVPLLIESIKELTARVAELESR